MVKWLQTQRKRWFDPILIDAEGLGIVWVLEDGRVLTMDEFIDESRLRGGGDSWFFRERTHWQVRWADGQRVSTVWLGLDHGFCFGAHIGPRPAMCWETCVFGPFGTGSGVTQRYATRWGAWKGHWKMVATVMYYRLKASLHREPKLKAVTKSEASDE